MLYSRAPRHIEVPAPEISASVETIDLATLIAAARRQWLVFAICCAIGILSGFLYANTVTPRYTAQTDLLIDSKQLKAAEDVASLTEKGVDSAAIDSQVEVLKSEKLALAVIDKLKLTEDPLFQQSSFSPVATVVSAAKRLVGLGQASEGPPDAATVHRRQRRAVWLLEQGLDITRVGRTYVLGLRFTSTDADKAAEVANAYAEAYLSDQLNSRYEANRRATDWLQQRIDELRQQASEADHAVQKFRSENNLITTDGKLVSDQQLAQVNAQLVSARAETAQARARYQRIAEILESKDAKAAVSESLASSIITDLRTKYLDASKRQAEISAKLGPKHLQAVSFRNQMEEYERLIFEELGRIAQSYLSEFNVAQSRETSLTSSLSGLVGVAASANESQVRLRQLEQSAETYKTLYQTFLTRYQEAIQQQSFPMTEARIITAANAPGSPSYPKSQLAIALALLFGGAVGVGLGTWREFNDRGFRTGEQVRDILRAEFLGMLPAIDDVRMSRRRTAKQRAERPGEERSIVLSSSLMRHVLDQPFSAFTETLRASKVAADFALSERRPKVIGVVSVLPGEGKTAVSKNLASLLSSQGIRTLLIDGDLRNPGLTRALLAESAPGSYEVLVQKKPWQEVLVFEGDSGLSVLPASLHRRVSHTSEILASSRMRDFLTEAGMIFDYIVIDLPPIGAVVDARAMSPLIDSYVFVVEWGKTARQAVRDTLIRNESIRERLLGVVFNKVNMNKLKMYEDHASADFYHEAFRDYYRPQV